MKLKKRYVFKIQAQNIYGVSDDSEESDEFDFSIAYSARTDTFAVVLGIIISVVFIVIGVVICLWCMYSLLKNT